MPSAISPGCDDAKLQARRKKRQQALLDYGPELQDLFDENTIEPATAPNPILITPDTPLPTRTDPVDTGSNLPPDPDQVVQPTEPVPRRGETIQPTPGRTGEIKTHVEDRQRDPLVSQDADRASPHFSAKHLAPTDSTPDQNAMPTQPTTTNSALITPESGNPIRKLRETRRGTRERALVRWLGIDHRWRSDLNQTGTCKYQNLEMCVTVGAQISTRQMNRLSRIRSTLYDYQTVDKQPIDCYLFNH